MNPSTFKIFNASAGSGKTFTLVKEYLKILIASDSLFKFKEVLAITFTNKAVAEMKERIIEKLKLFASDEVFNSKDDMFDAILVELEMNPKTLHVKSKQILDHIINNYAAFFISTIDGFTHKIIRTFAHDLKLPQNFEVEIDTDFLLSKAVDNLIAKAGNDKELTNVLVNFALEKTDDDKNWDISYDLNNIAKLLINETHISHLDSLKTKSLKDFQALKNNVFKKAVLLEQQIINKALSVLTLIKECGLEHNDFNGKNGYVPTYFQNLFKSDFNISFERAWMNKIETHPLYPKTKTTPEIASIIDNIQPQLATAFHETKQKVLQLKLLKNIHKNITPLSVLNAINNELKILKKEENLLLISEFNKIISDEIKNQPIPFIYERIGEKFKHYFIDEFQDTSEMQWQNLEPLIDNVLASETGTTMLVGDAKQAIYRWRGGKAEQFINLFNKKSKPFPVEQEVKNLPVNYRSAKEIINFNNKFFQYLSEFVFSNSDYASIFAKSNQDAFNELDGYIDINLLDYSKEDDKDEAYTDQVLATIQQILKNGYQLKDICILVRKRKEGMSIADVLSNHGINIISSETLLLQRSEDVNFLIDLMVLAIQPENIEIKAKVLDFIANKKNIENKHEFFLKYLELHPDLLFKNIQEFSFSKFVHHPIYDALEYAIRSFGLNKMPNAYIQFFLDEVLNFSNKTQASISGFLEYWETKKDKLSIVTPEGQDAVQIMTIHKAKGLEFPVVIFPYAELNIYDERPPKTWYIVDKNEHNGFNEVYLNLNKNIEEVDQQGKEISIQHRSELELDNINLLYVALTRPVEQLYIIGKKDTEFKEMEKCNTYSRLLISFLKSIGVWNDLKTHYSFGDPKKQSISKTENNLIKIQDNFISTPTSSHNISIVTKSGNLWDTFQKEAIEKGNLIHEFMSKIKTEIDIAFVLQEFKTLGFIDENQLKVLEKSIINIVSHPKLKSYFTQDNNIYNEKDIISTKGIIFRPDRIVVNPLKEAVIIDYKTGHHRTKHTEQLHEYAAVLQEMGFIVTNKILVYINDGIDIKEV